MCDGDESEDDLEISNGDESHGNQVQYDNEVMNDTDVDDDDDDEGILYQLAGNSTNPRISDEESDSSTCDVDSDANENDW